MSDNASAWNLLFEIDDGVSRDSERPAWRVGPIPTTPHHGWFGTSGPAIAWEHWPRSTHSGLPLVHVLTLLLPRSFQQRGGAFPGIAYFTESGEHFDPILQRDSGSDDPFLVDLARAVDHPQLDRRDDPLGSEHALIWLTVDEVLGGPVAPLADTRRAGEHVRRGVRNAWDHTRSIGRIWLVPREDPNAGLPLADPLRANTGGDGFRSPWNRERHEFEPWAQQLERYSHLGGTAFPGNTIDVDGFSPWYLELEEVGDVNFGGGNVQIDLASPRLEAAGG